jgi:hypothetical protein
MHGVQAISRKDPERSGNPQRLYARTINRSYETVRSAWRHAEPDGNELAPEKSGVTGRTVLRLPIAALVKSGQMLERLSISGYSQRNAAVKMLGVQIISRKDRIEPRGDAESSET